MPPRRPDPPGPFEWARYILFDYIPLWAWWAIGAAWVSVIIVASIGLLR